jgi:hypothetical protein
MLRCRPLRGLCGFVFDINLGLAPQALCLRLLTQAKKNDKMLTR